MLESTVHYDSSTFVLNNITYSCSVVNGSHYFVLESSDIKELKEQIKEERGKGSQVSFITIDAQYIEKEIN